MTYSIQRFHKIRSIHDTVVTGTWNTCPCLNEEHRIISCADYRRVLNPHRHLIVVIGLIGFFLLELPGYCKIDEESAPRSTFDDMRASNEIVVDPLLRRGCKVWHRVVAAFFLFFSFSFFLSFFFFFLILPVPLVVENYLVDAGSTRRTIPPVSIDHDFLSSWCGVALIADALMERTNRAILQETIRPLNSKATIEAFPRVAVWLRWLHYRAFGTHRLAGSARAFVPPFLAIFRGITVSLPFVFRVIP